MKLLAILAIAFSAGCLDIDEADDDIVGEQESAVEVRAYGDTNCRGSCGAGCAGCLETWRWSNGACHPAKRCRTDRVCRNHDTCYDGCNGDLNCMHWTDGRTVNYVEYSGNGGFLGLFSGGESHTGLLGMGAAFASCGLARRVKGADRCIMTSDSFASRTGVWEAVYFSGTEVPVWYHWQEDVVQVWSQDGPYSSPSDPQSLTGSDSSCDTKAVQEMWHTDQAKLYIATNAQEGPVQYYDGTILYPYGSPVTSNLCSPFMRAGEQLTAGQMRMSADGRFGLTYQKDGNLVLYKEAVPLWQSKTVNTSLGRTVMQSDGNLVVYNASNQAVWHSKTYGNAGAYVRIQDDGNLVIYAANGAVRWASGTCCH